MNATSPMREGSSPLQQRTRAGVSRTSGVVEKRSSVGDGTVVFPVPATFDVVYHSCGVERWSSYVDRPSVDVRRCLGDVKSSSSGAD
jgi:hypothetical protein